MRAIIAGLPLVAALWLTGCDRPGDGTSIGDWAYGVVVRGTKSAVEEAVRKAGSDATVKQAFPFLTAIVCSSD